MSGAPTLDTIVAGYMKLKGQRDAIKAKAKAEVGELEEKMSKLEAYILQKMEEDGVTSYKTPHGVAYKTTRDYANVADWEEVLNYVRTNNAYDLLERRVSKAAVKGCIDEGLPIPPGVTYTVTADITIRKPTQ